MKRFTHVPNLEKAPKSPTLMSSILTPEIIQLGPQRHLTTFQLNPQLKTKLLQAGFSVLKDLGGVKPSELARGNKCIRYFLITIC